MAAVPALNPALAILSLLAAAGLIRKK
ncbi:PGF-CTERM sorting domain-containing protein [Cesiribacter sp. SM1]